MYQQDKKRIYERKVALDSHAVHHFWNERAKNITIIHLILPRN